jgi:hypothetical protein
LCESGQVLVVGDLHPTQRPHTAWARRFNLVRNLPDTLRYENVNGKLASAYHVENWVGALQQIRN